KTTGTTFYRAKAVGVNFYFGSYGAFIALDSQLLNWRADFGENINMVQEYDKTYAYQKIRLFDYENIEANLIQTFPEQLDFLHYPQMDSMEVYYLGLYKDHHFFYYNNDKLDSVKMPNQ